MANLALVALGGALGSALRYLLAILLNGGFPYGTLVVNIVGCFAMGLLAGYGAFMGQLSEPWRVFLIVGVLGGFTTFSAFSLDVLTLAERGQLVQAAAYVLLSVVVSLFAVFGGVALVKALS